jgi:DNA-binding MarR family transcriptional regulator
MARRPQLPRSTFELLLRAARRVNERAIGELQRTGATGLRLAHTQLFPHITFDGVRLTEIARRLEVTKQAIGPLVDELVDAGMVERIADPADQRAKLIRWTRAGGAALRHGLGALARLEHQLAPAVGAARLVALADTLEALLAALDALPAGSPPTPVATERSPARTRS